MAFALAEGFMFSRKQARQDSNLQPPVLEPTPSNAGVAAFVDFQRLSFEAPTPALLDTAGVGTNRGTGEEPLGSSHVEGLPSRWPVPALAGESPAAQGRSVTKQPEIECIAPS